MGKPTWTVQIAFGAGPMAASPTWTDVTAYFRGASVVRGKDHEIDRDQAGTLAVRLNNDDRRFDPTFSTGPYYPNVLPMKQIRFRVTVNGVTYDLFRGHITDWGQAWLGRPINAAGAGEVTVSVVDAFKLLGLIDATSYRQAVLADGPLAYYPLDETADAAPNVYDLAGNDTTRPPPGVAGGIAVGVAGPLLGGATAYSNDGTEAIGPGTINPLPTGVILPNATPVTVEAWVYPTTALAGGIYTQGQDGLSFGVGFSGGGAAARPFAGNGAVSTAVATYQAPLNTWTHLAMTIVGTVATLYVNGAFQEVMAFGGTFLRRSGYRLPTTQGFAVMSNWSGRMAHVAFYSGALSSSRIAAHFAAGVDDLADGQTADVDIQAILTELGWPAGLTNLDAATMLLQAVPITGSALEQIMQLGEDSDRGLVYMDGGGVLRFKSKAQLWAATEGAIQTSAGDSGSEAIAYSDLAFTYDDQDLYSTVNVQTNNMDDWSETVAASATAYGPRTLDVSAPWLRSGPDQQSVALWMVNRFSAPYMRARTVVLIGGADNTRLAQMAQRDIGDMVTVVRRPPGGGAAISQACRIEGVRHEIAAQTGQWTTTWSVTPEPTQPWILGNATWGVLGSTTIPGE